MRASAWCDLAAAHVSVLGAAVTGSFLIAVVLELSTTGLVSQTTRLFHTAGVTWVDTRRTRRSTTRSSGSGPTAYDLAAWNLLITVPGCLIAGALGVMVARGIARIGSGLGT